VNILFVDDEERHMSMLVEELESRGHVVTLASDVDSALAIIDDASVTIDLVIMDVMMLPGTAFAGVELTRTGIALYQRLRSVRPIVPVIVYTNGIALDALKYFTVQNQRLCRFVHKPDVLPFEFADMMMTFVNNATNEEILEA